MTSSKATQGLQTLSITIKGNTPSKKNSRNLFVRGGRMMNIPSKRYKDWHEDATAQLSLAKLPSPDVLPLEMIQHITLTFYAPNKRKYDLTNRSESVMDLLVDCDILKDDNWSVVPSITILHGGIDKESPRCDIIMQWQSATVQNVK